VASYYIAATGNWNSASTWSATSGGAGGAGVPTSADSVTIDSNYTVTLNADANCNSMLISNGTLTANSYSMTIASYFQTAGNSNRTVNVGSGTWTINGVATGIIFSLDTYGTGITVFNANTSLIIFNYTNGTFQTSSYSFNNVIVNMFGTSETFTVNGSPTFRSLVIQSKNTSAHTVKFGAGATITTTTAFTGLGTSSGKVSLVSSTSGTNYNFTNSGTTTSDYLTIQDNYATGSPWYAGNNSVNTSNNTGWIFTAAPPPPTLTGITSLKGITSLTM
jgi:hypothetical protein